MLVKSCALKLATLLLLIPIPILIIYLVICDEEFGVLSNQQVAADDDLPEEGEDGRQSQRQEQVDVQLDPQLGP